MSRLSRPYIPLPVRVEVAERQTDKKNMAWALYLVTPWQNLTDRLHFLLTALFGAQPYQLDHDPALSLRRYSAGHDRFYPDANDPNHLVYRAKDGHLQKTTGRKPGAERTVTSKGSDVWLKKKFDRLEGRTKRRPKQKIRSRGFQKGKRKINAAKTTRT